MAEPSVFKYRAFLSYAHADGRTARWLHKALEGYPIDPVAVGRVTALGAVPKNLRPIFLDREDFAGGHSLTDATVAALDKSAALIVLCSKVAATRPAVAEEVRLFRWRHPERPVIPVILDGDFPDNFPPPLRFEIAPDGTVTDRAVTILGPDLRTDADGRELALAKIVSGLTGLATLDVFNRFKRKQAKQARRRWAIAGALLLSLAGAGYFFHDARQKGEVIAVRETERSQALDIARQLLGANPAAAAAPGQEQSLVAALTAIQEQAARGDGDYAKAFELLKAGKGAEAVPLLIAAADAKKARAAKENKDAAKAYREAAAVASVAEPWKARELYAEAARLDAEDVDGLFQHGTYQLKAGNLGEAEAALKRAAVSQSVSDERLAWIQFWLGEIAEQRGQSSAALEGYARARDRIEALLVAQPNSSELKRTLAVFGSAAGDVLSAQGDHNGANDAYLRSQSLIRELLASSPDDAVWQRELSVYSRKLGKVFALRGDVKGALLAFEEVKSIREQLAHKHPAIVVFQTDLAVSLESFGDILLESRNLEKSLKAFRDSLNIRERLAKADPGNAGWQRDLSVSHEKVGGVLVAQGQLPDALKAFRDSLAIAERLAKADPGSAEWQSDLSVSYDRVGDVLVAQGRLLDALTAFRDGLAIRERLAKADPGNAGWQRDLALSYGRVANIQAQSGETEGAREGYGKARDIIARLVKLSPDNATLPKDLAYYDAQIAALDAP